MRGINKKWEDQYNKTIPLISGRNKIHALGDTKGGPVATKSLGLASAFAEVDKLDPNQIAPKDRSSKDYKAYDAAVSKLKTEKKTYSAYVKAAIDVVDKREFPKAYRELKQLSTQLSALVALVENHQKACSEASKLDKIQDKKNAEKEKAKKKSDEAEREAAIKEAEAEAAMKKFLIMISTGGKSAVKKGLAAVQTMKADPTAKNYNAVMLNAGRDFSQWLVNIQKLKAHSKYGKQRKVKAITAPDDLVTLASRYGDGDLRRIDETTPDDQVKQHIKAYSQLLKQAAARYADILKGKF